MTSLRPAVAPVNFSVLCDDKLAGQLDDRTAKTLVSGVSVDSADLEPGWVFVAIPGQRRHGIDYAAKAVASGASVVVTDKEGAEKTEGLEVPVVIVDDPRLEGALMASRFYLPYLGDLIVVGVTGTNGKTTSTYLLRGALEPKFKKVALMGTLEISVEAPGQTPLVSERTTAEAPVIYRALALAAENGYGAAVVEASSHALSLHRVAGLKFASVMFTNLQHDHLDFYGTMESYYEAKAELFTSKHARMGVVCVDDRWGQKLARSAKIPLETVSALQPTPQTLTNPGSHWEAAAQEADPHAWGTFFDLMDPQGQLHECFCPIPGLVNVQNSALSLVCATQVGVPLQEAIAGLSATAPPPGRMEVVPRGANQPLVLVDYAHTPEALEALLQTLRPLVTGRVILVFGTDGDRDASKREPLAQIAARLGDELWITDENPRTEDPQQVRDYLLRGASSIRVNMDGVTEVKTSRRDAIRKAIMSARKDDLVAILGKGAEPYQEIDGVHHSHLDAQVAAEVLRDTANN